MTEAEVKLMDLTKPELAMRLAEANTDLAEARAQRDWLIKECARIGVTVNVIIGAPLTEAYQLVK